MRTGKQVVVGKEKTAFVVGKLLDASQWFEFTPLPDDRYEICVKEENQHFLTKTADLADAVLSTAVSVQQEMAEGEQLGFVTDWVM